MRNECTRTNDGHRQCLAIVLTACLLGCSRDVPLGPGLPLLLEASVQPSVLEPSHSVRISLRIKNAGRGPVTVRFPSTCHMSFEVRTAGGVVVAPVWGACGAAITYRTFAPGVETVEFAWAGEIDWGRPERVTAGEYHVVAGLGVPLRAEAPPVPLVIH